MPFFSHARAGVAYGSSLVVISGGIERERERASGYNGRVDTHDNGQRNIAAADRCVGEIDVKTVNYKASFPRPVTAS